MKIKLNKENIVRPIKTNTKNKKNEVQKLFFDEKRMRLLLVSNAFQSLQRSSYHAARTKLGELAAKLQSLSPLAVLARGYALASDQGGKPIQSVAALHDGDPVFLRLADGTADCTITGIHPLNV